MSIARANTTLTACALRTLSIIGKMHAIATAAGAMAGPERAELAFAPNCQNACVELYRSEVVVCCIALLLTCP